MTNVEMLQNKIQTARVKRTALAAAMGVSMPTFYSRISGNSEFNASEIIALTRVLHLSKDERDAIFLAENVN